MTDTIYRKDAIEAVGDWMQKEFGYLDLNRAERLIDALSALPSADAVSREDYHNLLTASNDIDRALREYQAKDENQLAGPQTGELISRAEPTVIRSRTFMPTKDFKEWAKRIREINPNAVVIPCDAEVVSAEAVQGEGVRCGECKHRYMDGEVTHYYWCRLHDRPVDDTDYCAWGEEGEVEE